MNNKRIEVLDTCSYEELYKLEEYYRKDAIYWEEQCKKYQKAWEKLKKENKELQDQLDKIERKIRLDIRR